MKDRTTHYYSHGMDKIYSYETINPSSVRPLNGKEKNSPSLPKSCQSHKEVPPLTFHLFPTPTELLREKEPLDSLRLSPFAMKAIKTFSLETTGQLRHMVFHNKIALRSIGQGHLDEIENKLDQFFLDTESSSYDHIDISSCIRLVLSKVPQREKAILASSSQLKQFCFIPPAEEKEADLVLRRLSKESQEELFQKLKTLMAQPLRDVADILSSTFIKPLLQKNGGIVSQNTIRLAFLHATQIASLEIMQNIDSFFQKILLPQERPWYALSFEYVNKGFLCLTKEYAAQAEEVLQEANALLRLTKEQIPLHALAHTLWLSQVKRWNPLDETTIEELLYWNSCPFTLIEL